MAFGGHRGTRWWLIGWNTNWVLSEMYGFWRKPGYAAVEAYPQLKCQLANLHRNTSVASTAQLVLHLELQSGVRHMEQPIQYTLGGVLVASVPQQHESFPQQFQCPIFGRNKKDWPRF